MTGPAATLPPNGAQSVENPPPVIQRVFWTTVGWVSLSVLSGALLFAHRDYVQKALVTSNSKLKKPRDLSGDKLPHAVTASLIGGLAQLIVIGLLTVGVAYFLRRGRYWARWVLLVLAVLPLFGMGILVQLIGGLTTSTPGDYKVVSVLAGLCALAIVVLLLTRDTTRWFAELRGRTLLAPRTGIFGAARRQNAAQSAVDPDRVVDVEPTADAVQAESVDGRSVDTASEVDTEPASDRPRSGAKPKTATSTPRTNTGRNRRR